jgi:hypothetical protein
MKRKEGHKKGLTLYFRKKNASKALDYDSVVALTVRIISSVCLSNLMYLSSLCFDCPLPNANQIPKQKSFSLSFFTFHPTQLDNDT